MSDESLRVKLQLNDEDLRRFWQHAIDRQGMRPSRFKLVLTWLVLLPMLAVVPYLFTAVRTEGEMVWTMMLLMGFGGYVILAFEKQRSNQFACWMQSDDTKSLLQPTTMEFSADGITSASERLRSWYAWSMVNDVRRADGRIFIWLGSARCYILPERSFRDGAAIDAFLATIEKHRMQAHGAALECPQCGYDLRGDSRVGCPECGWGREAASP